ncbi:MAG: AmmeMemoRadiSam system protein A [Acidimicrobiales bacterium]
MSAHPDPHPDRHPDPHDELARLDDRDLDALLAIAQRSLDVAVRADGRWRPDLADVPPALRGFGAAFVTLRRQGRLRGCVGTLVADAPLAHAVAARAVSAAFDDPRFEPVRPDELHDLEVSVSVLSPMTPFEVRDLDDLLARVRPHVDGLVVESGRHRAVLLPEVWDDLPDPRAFVDALWRKAGLRAGEWPRDIRLSRFASRHWPA